MSEYHEMQKEAAEARAGADRMAAGLSCIPDPVRGDLAEVTQLRHDIEQLVAASADLATENERLRGEVAWLTNALNQWAPQSALEPPSH